MKGLHRLGFEWNKIYNGAVYTDLNCLLLQLPRGVANYNRVIDSTVYIAVDPRTPSELKT